jgi:hypothetical protein
VRPQLAICPRARAPDTRRIAYCLTAGYLLQFLNMDPTPPRGGNDPQGAKASTSDGGTSQSQQQEVQQVFGFDLDLGSSVMIAVMLLLGLLQRELLFYSCA